MCWGDVLGSCVEVEFHLYHSCCVQDLNLMKELLSNSSGWKGKSLLLWPRLASAWAWTKLMSGLFLLPFVWRYHMTARCVMCQVDVNVTYSSGDHHGASCGISHD